MYLKTRQEGSSAPWSGQICFLGRLICIFPTIDVCRCQQGTIDSISQAQTGPKDLFNGDNGRLHIFVKDVRADFIQECLLVAVLRCLSEMLYTGVEHV